MAASLDRNRTAGQGGAITESRHAGPCRLLRSWAGPCYKPMRTDNTQGTGQPSKARGREGRNAMTPRTIMVHVDDTPNWRVRLEVARGLLGDDTAGGHVVGLYGVVDQTERHPYTRQASGDRPGQGGRGRGAVPRGLPVARPVLRLARHPWRRRQPDRHPAFGQPADRGSLRGVATAHRGCRPVALTHDVIEHMATSGGRPLLVLPYITKNFTTPKRIVIALNEDGASARALSAALPILQGAERSPPCWRSAPTRWRSSGGRLGSAPETRCSRPGIKPKIEHEIPGRFRCRN